MVYQLWILIVVLWTVGGVQQAAAETTGKSAAMKYFIPRSPASASIQTHTRAPSPSQPSDNLLALSVGSLMDSKSYQWIGNDFNGWNVEASYIAPAGGYLTRGLHIDLQKFLRGDQEISKLSFLISFSFPRRLSFPLYIGVAAGPGYFLKPQLNESDFTLDYKAYLGLRLSKSYSHYFLESGVKNHVHVLSNGQFVGWFFSSGVAYKF